MCGVEGGGGVHAMKIPEKNCVGDKPEDCTQRNKAIEYLEMKEAK